MELKEVLEILDAEYSQEMEDLHAAYSKYIKLSQFHEAEMLVKKIHITIGKKDALRDFKEKLEHSRVK